MKKTTAKVITISDLVQWHEKQELELSPKYQRNSVWNENAKAYLIDTIVRGLPIPPIFMRQQVDVNTKTTHREIIDGQQRVRSILEYVVSESFFIRKNHNKELGGKKYSDLSLEDQEALLEYEILTEVVTEKDESVVYDMFARLNSNNIVLNRQEIRNSKYWGDFKVLVYRMSSKYRDFFLEHKLLCDKECSRMKDSELISSMLILITEGIVSETPNYVDNIYGKYDNSFSTVDIVEKQFTNTMTVIEKIYEYLNGNEGRFSNKNYFYTLYAVIYNQMYGISEPKLKRCKHYEDDNIYANINEVIDKLVYFISEFSLSIENKNNDLDRYEEYKKFEKCHKQRTTNKNERLSRISILNNIMAS